MTLGKGSRVSFATENKAEEGVNAAGYLALAIDAEKRSTAAT
jgi:hypothetical protein